MIEENVESLIQDVQKIKETVYDLQEFLHETVKQIVSKKVGYGEGDLVKCRRDGDLYYIHRINIDPFEDVERLQTMDEESFTNIVAWSVEETGENEYRIHSNSSAFSKYSSFELVATDVEPVTTPELVTR